MKCALRKVNNEIHSRRILATVENIKVRNFVTIEIMEVCHRDLWGCVMVDFYMI